MEQVFVLKYYGKFSLDEMAYLTAEDRAQIYNRILEELKKQNGSDDQRNQGLGGSRFS
jgi:hypothetical protein